MKTVYMCSPFRADTAEERKENIDLARRVCRWAVLSGYQVECPHLFYPQFLDDNDPEQREIGMELGAKKLEAVDEVWVVGNRISEGMSREIAKASEMGIPVKCVSDPLTAEEQLLNAILSVEE